MPAITMHRPPTTPTTEFIGYQTESGSYHARRYDIELDTSELASPFLEDDCQDAPERVEQLRRMNRRESDRFSWTKSQKRHDGLRRRRVHERELARLDSLMTAPAGVNRDSDSRAMSETKARYLQFVLENSEMVRYFEADCTTWRVTDRNAKLLDSLERLFAEYRRREELHRESFRTNIRVSRQAWQELRTRASLIQFILNRMN